MKLWKGRFSKAATSSADEFNASIEFDQRLYREDITGSIAHAKMLAKQGIIPQEDRRSDRQDPQGDPRRHRSRQGGIYHRIRRYPYEYRKHPYRKDRRRRQKTPYCTKQKRSDRSRYPAVSKKRNLQKLTTLLGRASRCSCKSLQKNTPIR